MKIGFTSMSIEEFLRLLPELLPIIIPILVLQFILLAVSLISIFKKRLPFNQIALWLLIVVFGSIIGMVVYFAIGSKILDDKVDTESGNSDE